MVTSPILRRLPLLAAVLLLGACAGMPDAGSHARDPALPAEAARIAQSMQGQPYRWGGEDPDGFDCSGLVHYAYQQAGVRVPRTARQQYEAVRPLYVDQLVPGDLVFFTMPGKFLSHVGIYIGDRRFVHALNPRNPVMVSNIDDDYWQRRLVRAGSLVR
ncbi:MAG: C40 family peptidase [Halofilum sp. (in: g-proteobacteria)]|nr:C40 family peptidase [Halofilum sp. (in: g-proteobacteria)]